MPAGQGNRRGQLIPCRHPADTDGRAAARGFDEHRQPEPLSILEFHRVLTRSQHDVVADRQALGDEQLLGELLVHARRAGQHTRADVRHPGKLEQALDGAVLAVRTVQNGEHDVDRGEHLAALAEGQQLATANRVGRQVPVRCPIPR